MSKLQSRRTPRAEKAARAPKAAKTSDTSVAPAQPARPGGKLGLIIDRLTSSAGATANELAECAEWQKHSVLGALSRLRASGFTAQLETRGERRAYCSSDGRTEGCTLPNPPPPHLDRADVDLPLATWKRR